MRIEDLELQNGNGETALSVAAGAGNVKMAEIMVRINETLLTIPDSQGKFPLCKAALFGNHEMVKYLYGSQNMNSPCWTQENRDYVLVKCVEADLFDIALQIVEDYPELATNGNALGILARKPYVFAGEDYSTMWEITEQNELRDSFRAMINSLIHAKDQLNEASSGREYYSTMWKIIKQIIFAAIDPPNEASSGREHYSAMWKITIPSVLTNEAWSGDSYIYLADVKPQYRFRGLINIYIFPANDPPNEASSSVKLLRIIWSSILKLHKDKINDIIRGPPDPTNPTVCRYSSHMLFVAVEKGNTRFVVELICRYPDLIRMVNHNNQSIFHIAVSHRRAGIYNLLKETRSIKDSVISLEDENGNNILHLAGEKAKGDQLQDMPGVVLQMQQELIWFKVVEATLPYSFREKKNRAGLTPREVFTENHKDLVTKGEKWMKEVATQLMVVATLIATVTFAVPFTVPGGFNQDSGTPIFIQKRLFTVLIIVDALSLMSASTSLLYVISILTTCYAERNFLMILPSKLGECLLMLTYALVMMMLTFVISFFIFYQNRSLGAPISIAVLAFVVFGFFRTVIFRRSFV